MAGTTILTITGDERFLAVLRQELHDQGGGGSRMIVAPTIDEACSLFPMAEPRLIVVHWGRHGGRYEELNRLLWATTNLTRRAPVLIIADRYRIDQATTFYRMGVTDYISRTHHGDQFGRILDSYLRQPASSPRMVKSSDDLSVEPVKAWCSAPPPLAAQVV